MREIAKRVSLRLDSTEYAHLKQLSMDTGLKMEPVIRRLIVGAELRPHPPGELTELLHQMSLQYLPKKEISGLRRAARHADTAADHCSLFPAPEVCQ